MTKQLFNKKSGALISLGLLSLVFVSPVSAEVQASWSAELVGKWMKSGTGETIDFKEKGDVDLFLSGQATSFSGNGSFDRCTDGGANLCITGARLKCAYRYSLVQGILNLQFRSGAPDVACKAATGDFRSMK
jgi:hypothetical protein